ncbi:MAG: TonB-dependent receptor [Acidobacteriota bacterium]
MKLRIFAVILTLCLQVVTAFAQSTSGKIVGTVSAADGAVPGATIVVTDNQTKKERTVTANGDGTFVVSQLEFGTYTVTISASGFKTFSSTDVKVDAARESSLNAKLEVGQVSETVTVTAGTEQINTSNGELSTTISREQIRELPLNGRSALNLVSLAAGAGPTTSSIDGQRSSSTTITRDGLNVQDNFIRTGAFVDDRPTVDDTGEFTITTQNAGAEQGGGSSLIQLVTPRGGTKFHGNLYAFNRNSKFTANDFFNNEQGIEKPFLNRNEFGGSISGPSPFLHFGEGGPVVDKNKAFFFFNYEGFRLAQQVSTSATTLLPQARNGDFTYIDTATGQQKTINVLTGAGFANPVTAAQGGILGVDPVIQSRILSQLPTSGNGVTTGINFTQAVNFNIKNPITRNQWIFRYDVEPNDKNSFSLVYKNREETNTRPDIASGFSTTPFVDQIDPTKFLSAAYRLTPTAHFSNEVRGGFQLTKPFFLGSNIPSDYFIGGLPLITDPAGSFTDQGRNTSYYNIQDNAVYSIGNHSFRFGGQVEFQKLESSVLFGVLPTYNISTTGNLKTPGLTTGQIGNINTTDLARANSLRYLLGGIIGTANQTFNLIDPQTGYASTADIQPLDYKIYSTYVSDQWRLRPDFTLNLGLRYEYYTPLHSPIGNYLEPVINNNDIEASILNPNGFLDIIGGNSGRRGTFTKPDKNNFGPNVSFAYSPKFDNGLSSHLLGKDFVVRGGFRVNYVNDEYVKSTSTLLGGNPGLRSVTSSLVNGSTTFASALTPRNGFGGIPIFTPPAFTPPPLSFEDNNNNQGGAQVFGVDPNLQVQRVLEYNVGIQRNIGFKSVLEIRYVGGRSNDLIQTTTFNQLDIKSTGFFSDFLKAQQNCRLQGATRPGAATAYDTLFLCTDARYNPAIAGSQPLNVFDNLTSGGFLNNAGTILPLIQAGRAGSLAQFYFLNGLNGDVPIVKNPNIFLDEILQNAGRYRYNALQAEIRRRFSDGFSFQANYTFAKTLTDIPVDSQNRQGEVQDRNNPNLNYSRPDYERTHTFNFNAVYQLPFGKGKHFLDQGGWVDRVIGGFQFTSIINLVSGPPISVIDPRSTSTITFQSGRQSATTSLTLPELKKLTGTFRTPNGIYFFDPKILCATATAPGQPTLSCFDLNQTLPVGYTLNSVRAASPLGQAPFPGQVFFFDEAGSTGNIQRNALNGTPYLNWDAGLSKNIRFGETQRLQLRFEAFNVLNKQIPLFGTTAAYTNGFLNVNSNSFGRITSIYNTPRIIQFGVRYDF